MPATLNPFAPNFRAREVEKPKTNTAMVLDGGKKTSAILRVFQTVERVATDEQFGFKTKPLDNVLSDTVGTTLLGIGLAFTAKRLVDTSKEFMESKRKNAVGVEVDKEVHEKVAEVSGIIASTAMLGKLSCSTLALAHSWNVLTLSGSQQKTMQAVATPFLAITLIFSTVQLVLGLLKYRSELEVWNQGLGVYKNDYRNVNTNSKMSDAQLEKNFQAMHKKPQYGWKEAVGFVDLTFSLLAGAFGVTFPPGMAMTMVIGLSTLNLAKAYSGAELHYEAYEDAGDSLHF